MDNMKHISDAAEERQKEEKNWESMVKLAGSLADSIRQTAAYNEYIAARERLNQDAANRQVLEELREQQYNIDAFPHDEKDERRQRILDEIYMAVSLNPVVSDYLNAEYKLELMMDEIRKAFGDLFDFDEEDNDIDRFSGSYTS